MEFPKGADMKPPEGYYACLEDLWGIIGFRISNAIVRKE
jgi:hypothetical protein